MADLLSDAELAERLPPEWDRDGDEIVRTYEFDDYLEGVDFAREVAELADEAFHHPEIRVRWREVEVRFTTHDEGGVTDRDVEMAGRCDDAFA